MCWGCGYPSGAVPRAGYLSRQLLGVAGIGDQAAASGSTGGGWGEGVGDDRTGDLLGIGGTFCVKYPEISVRMVSDKTKDIVATGAETVLAGDLGCLLNIAGRLQREGTSSACPACGRGAGRNDRRSAGDRRGEGLDALEWLPARCRPTIAWPRVILMQTGSFSGTSCYAPGSITSNTPGRAADGRAA